MPPRPDVNTPPRRSPRPAILATALLAAATLLTTPTQAAFIDVSKVPSGHRSSLPRTPIGSDSHLSQVFVVEQSGILTQIDLDLQRYRGAAGEFVVEIRRAEGGVPGVGPESVLFTGFYDVGSLPLRHPWDDEYKLQLTSYDVSGAGIEVAFGDVFAIDVHRLDRDQRRPEVSWYRGGLPYAAGAMYWRSSLDDEWERPGDADIVGNFRTWVEPQESYIQLVIDRITGEIYFFAHDLSMNGVQIYSPSGGLNVGDLDPEIDGMFVLGTPTERAYAEVSFSNHLYNGRHSLGFLYNTELDAMDLQFDYIHLGAGTKFRGDVEYLSFAEYYVVPEPASLAMITAGLLGLLRRRGQGV